MKIVSGFEKVEKREILDCRIKSLKELMCFWGYQISSFELLILCEAITFRYGYINYKDHNISGVPYVTSTNMDIHKYLFEKLKIEYKCEEISNDDLGLEKIKKLLDDQIPVLVELDGSVFMKRRKEHNMDMHYISYVLVVGYDEETREIAIVLTQSSQTETYVTLRYEDFQNSRIKECFPYKTTGKCYYLTKAIDIDNIDIEGLLKGSLKNISSVMLKGGDPYGIYSEAIEITNMCIGLPTMKKFIGDYKLKSRRLLTNKNLKSFYQLELLILRNNIQYGSLTCYREEFAKGLHMAAEKYHLSGCEEAAILFEKSSGYWKKLIWQIGVLAKNKNKVSYRGMRKISDISQKIYKQERKAFCLLADME